MDTSYIWGTKCLCMSLAAFQQAAEIDQNMFFPASSGLRGLVIPEQNHLEVIMSRAMEVVLS